jgi:hypothetical protein
MPRLRAREATSSLKSSHSSSSPEATTKLESARNSPPNGVEPRAAATASARSGSTRRPTASGARAAARRSRSGSRSSAAVAGRCQAVVAPKRPAAIRRAVSSETKAFGVVPCAFQ